MTSSQPWVRPRERKVVREKMLGRCHRECYIVGWAKLVVLVCLAVFVLYSLTQVVVIQKLPRSLDKITWLSTHYAGGPGRGVGMGMGMGVDSDTRRWSRKMTNSCKLDIFIELYLSTNILQFDASIHLINQGKQGSHWKDLVSEKRIRQKAAIPQEWILENLPSEETLNVWLPRSIRFTLEKRDRNHKFWSWHPSSTFGQCILVCGGTDDSVF